MNKILITGARRCGTTFVGKVLSKSDNAKYFFEPFNKDQGVKYLPNYWYPFFSENNITEYQNRILNEVFINQKVNYKTSLYSKDYTWWDLNRYDLLKNLFTNFSQETLFKRLVRVFFKNRSNFEYLKYKFSFGVKNIIYKDPLASLSANFLTKRYKLKTVVLLRHPYSYYYSMKKQDWGANPYSNFFAQKSLYQNMTREYEIILKKHENNTALYSLIEYIVVYKELLKYNTEESFCFIRHEDLSSKPINVFEDIYKFCELNFNEKIKLYIYKNTNSSNHSDTKVVSKTKRDSKSLINNWKGKISKEEMSLIKELTFDCIKNIYPENEW
jgi:Sulfotransferase family